MRLGSAESHPWIHCERLRLSKILILTLVLIVPVILLVPVFLIARPVLSTCNITRLSTWKVIRLFLWRKCWASCNCHTCSLEDVSTLRFKSQLNFAPDLQQLFTSASFSANRKKIPPLNYRPLIWLRGQSGERPTQVRDILVWPAHQAELEPVVGRHGLGRLWGHRPRNKETAEICLDLLRSRWRRHLGT